MIRNRTRGIEAGKAERPMHGSDLGDRFDQVLVEGDEFGAFLVVDEHVCQIDEETLLLIHDVGDTVPHRWDDKIANIISVDGSDSDPDFFPLTHVELLG
jgi:hypothetical protein